MEPGRCLLKRKIPGEFQFGWRIPPPLKIFGYSDVYKERIGRGNEFILS
jgi:hypothetical protein